MCWKIRESFFKVLYQWFEIFLFQAFCDVTRNVYDRNAPTKQNLLCHRQAVQEVMLNHPDLKVEKTPDAVEQQKLKQKIHMDSFQILEQDEQDSQNQAYGTGSQVDESFREFNRPRFAYVLPARRRHILVLDVSEGMNR